MTLLNDGDISRLKKEVLSRITPKKSELSKINKLTDEIIHLLKLRAQKIGLRYVFIEPQGSTGKKQTHLTSASDIDIFVGLPTEDYQESLKLNKKARNDKIKQIFLDIVNRLFIPVTEKIGCDKREIFYAEHPYLKAKKGIYDIDIVGCFSLSKEELLKNGPITAVDRTPIHTKIINESLTSEQKNDVRLLKAFFQACYAYGDQCAVGQFGFTGFCTEVLILHFESLFNTFQNFNSILKKPIDFFDRKPEELLNFPRFNDDYFIIIDPTDPERNIASSISKRAFDYVNYRISKFLEAPFEVFFEMKPIRILNAEELSKISSHTWVLEFLSNGTVHYTELRDKLYKLGNRIKMELEKEHTGEERFGKCIFTVYFEKHHYSLAFYCSQNNLSKMYLRRGPPLKLKAHVEQFKAKNPNSFIKNDHIWAEMKRKYVKLSQLISDYIKNIKIKGLNLINQSSIGLDTIGKKALTILFEIILSVDG